MLAGVRVRIAGCAVFEHQEPLAVRRHVVRARGKRRRVPGVEHLRRLARAERRSGCLDRHRRQRIRCIEVEQLAAAPRPRGASSARRRDLPAAAVDVRERPHVDLGLPGLTLRHMVREVATVGRELRPRSVEQGLGGARHRDTTGRARQRRAPLGRGRQWTIVQSRRRVFRPARWTMGTAGSHSSSAGRLHRCRRRPGCTGSGRPRDPT